MPRNALGRGLSALIREPEPAPSMSAELAGSPRQVDIDLIDPSPFQPRTRFPEEQIEELARSIRASGVIQPLLIRPIGTRFELIAGERRWRAAQRAGLHRVPAVIREASDEAALEMTLVENIQRENLNPMEEARAYTRLMAEFRLTQEKVAERTGKDRATIANSVRLLRLEAPIQTMLEDGQLSAGHGRALLAIENIARRMELAKKAAGGSLTVRQLEQLSRKNEKPAQQRKESRMDPNTKAAVEQLQQTLGTRVLLRSATKRRPGLLMIEYYNEEQLQGIYERIVG